MTSDKLSWFFADPQIIIDNETHDEFAIVDLEFGWMTQNFIPSEKGQSFNIHPSFGVGVDRPTDYSVELGYKIVGW